MLKHLSFLSLKINPNIFGVASYTISAKWKLALAGG
jgi:hypothetical protein